MKAWATILGLNPSNPRSISTYPSARADPAIEISGERMNNILMNVRDLLNGNSRKVTVWSDNGVVQGKAHCRQREVAGYIDRMLKLSNGTLKVVIAKE